MPQVVYFRPGVDNIFEIWEKYPNINWGASLRFPNSLEAENNPHNF